MWHVNHLLVAICLSLIGFFFSILIIEHLYHRFLQRARRGVPHNSKNQPGSAQRRARIRRNLSSDQVAASKR